MCFEIGIKDHTRKFLMDCDFSILFNYDYVTLYCVHDYMLTILIIPNVFFICHVYYIHILYVLNINNAVAQKAYISIVTLFLPHSPYSYIIFYPRLLMTFRTCISQLGRSSAILFQYTHLLSKVCYISKTYFMLKHHHVL